MKKAFLLVVCVLLIFTFTACQPQTETKYLQTSVTQEYVGNVTFRTETEYDSEGVQTAFIQYMNGEETSRMEYSYTDNSVIAKTTQNGETGTMKQVYEKDEAGNIIRTEMYIDDVLYAITDCTYDERGNRLTNVQETVALSMTFATTNTYDEHDNLIKIVNDYGSGSGSIAENTYDEKGRLILSLLYDLEGNPTGREEHVWLDEVTEHIEAYEGEGCLPTLTDNTYDEHGNMLTSETYDNEGNLTLRITYTYKAFEVPVK